jgi:hypothetical protein
MEEATQPAPMTITLAGFVYKRRKDVDVARNRARKKLYMRQYREKKRLLAIAESEALVQYLNTISS